MLRITIHNGDGPVRIQLEGKLAGPFVQEAELCWQEVLARPHAAAPRFDLTGVTQMDAAGKTFLAAARAQGAKLTASGCLMRAIIADLAKTTNSGHSVDFKERQSTDS